MDWFLYDNGLRHERVKPIVKPIKNVRSSQNFILANFIFSFFPYGHVEKLKVLSVAISFEFENVRIRSSRLEVLCRKVSNYVIIIL